MNVSIQTALAKLGIPLAKGENFSCPNKSEHPNGDRNPSAGIYDNGHKWKCRACGAGGNAARLVMIARGCDYAEAARLLGIPLPPPELRLGTTGELETLARMRGIEAGALRLAQTWGILRFGDNNKCGVFWAVTDSTKHATEARRLDGQPWPWGTGKMKAWAFKGSKKDWPVGLKTGTPVDKCSIVTLCEGPPDTLAALNLLAIAGRVDIAPCCMLGASANLGAEAVEAIAGRPVLIWAQPDKAGITGAQRWAAPLVQAGGTVKIIRPFPHGDLNDWLRTRPSREQVQAAIPFPKTGGVE